VKLAAPEHLRWWALRRVNGGGVARSGDCWLQHGRPLGLLLTEFLGVLLEEGLVQTGDPSPEDSLSRVTLTDAGKARYSELCRQQRRKDHPGAEAR